MKRLPDGWSVSTLGALMVERGGSVNPATFPDEEFELYSIPAHDREGFEVVRGAAIGSSKRLVAPGDVMVSKIVPHIQRARIVGPRGERRQIASTEWIVFRSDVHDPAFLRYFLLSPDFHRQFMETVSGVGGSLNRAQPSRVKPIPIPVPPREEQCRIVAILEDHLSRLDAAVDQLRRVEHRSAVLLRSALSQGLRGTLVSDDTSEGTGHGLLRSNHEYQPADDERWWPVPDSWAWTRLGDMFEVNVGTTPSRSDPGAWSGNLPWVSSGEVAFGRISTTREHIKREAAGNPAKRIHPPGTVMLAMIGEGKTRGQAAILDIEAAHNQNCASIRVSATQVLPEYVYGYLEERYLETRRGGSGGQQPALNKAAIERFPIPIPPLGTQRRLVAAWAEFRASSQRLSNEAARAADRAVGLRRALLAAAFAGRLAGTVATALEMDVPV